jgi:hypothetical protein
MATKKNKSPVFQIKVRGTPKGRMPVPGLIKICDELQQAVLRQAEASEGRISMHPGPSTAEIKKACTLELVGIKSGSTCLIFGLAKKQLVLPFDAAQEKGYKVVREVATAIKSLGNGNMIDVDEGVMRSLYKLADVVGTSGVTDLDFIVPRADRFTPRIVAPLTKTLKEKIAKSLSRPRSKEVEIDGVLEMADFKIKDRKCRISPAIGTAVVCTFNEDQEDKIQTLLRQPVRIKGIGKFQPNKEKVESVEIQTVEPLSSLALGENNFFSGYSLDQLAELQGVGIIEDASVLSGVIPETEDIDEFLKEIYEARR